MSLTQTQIWQSILDLSGISASVSSSIQRTLGKKHLEMDALGLGVSPAPERPVAQRVPESVAGRLLSTSS